ncbi:hypothetical protein OS175_00480 [Marinicella sp. S1101]|uniref:hypothetical protein n=1 Tax=Marinicella marina TaxID=2996016 RepID=UPI002260EF89|nr:hypothetical protein [Marinicella marina]MCX7552338.1 hypothetical protein [Marinicella marina]MDJ1139213.1 hypothetical protein [Marinicella marina]
MSVTLISLWLPILLGGIFCWVVSALFHMVVKHHDKDYQALGAEDAVSDALRGTAPGLYTLPHCKDMQAMNDEGMQQKFKQGPVAMVSVMDNGMPPMGKLMVQQIIYYWVAVLLIAYVAHLSLPMGADYLAVFRQVMATGFLTFGFGLIPFSIWYGHPWSNTVRYLIDALIYAAVVAGTFAWLWPAAA